MKIQYMREFVAMKEYGNFSNTAKNLFITQPALSRHIAELEKDLNVRLLVRDKHSVTFTEAGQKALKSFQRIIHTYDTLSQDLSEYKNGVTGELRLGMLYYTIEQDFGTIMIRFCEKYPNVTIRRYSGQPQDIYRELAEDKIDIGVLPKCISPDTDFLYFSDIQQHGMDVMMSTHHNLSSKKLLTFDDIQNETCIELKDDPISNQAYSSSLEKCGFKPEHIIQTDNIDTVPFLLQKTNAIYIKPAGFSVVGFDKEITVRPLNVPNLLVTKSYAYRKDNTNPLIPLFLEMTSGGKQ